MKNSKEWISVSELLAENFVDFPKTDKGISKKADREGWSKRQRIGVKGRTFEYYVGDMPKAVQQALGFAGKPQQVEPQPEITQTPTLEQAMSIVQKALEELENTPKSNAQTPNNEGLSQIEQRLLQCFRKASKEGQEAIISTAETMAALQEKKETEAQPLENHQLNAA